MPDIVRQPGARLTGQVDARLAKRFYPGPLANLRRSYNAFHAFDKTHAVALADAGLIPPEAARAILAGLREMEAQGIEAVRDRMGGGRHSGEAFLTEKLGANVAGWINLGPVTVRITAHDNGGAALASISYSATGSQVIPLTTIPLVTPNDTTDVSITAQGVTVVSFQATDANGKSSPIQTVTVKLDSTAPTAVLSPGPNAAGWNCCSSAFTITGSDGLSGVATIDYTASGATILQNTVNGSVATFNLNEGNTTLLFSATDVAGNPTSPQVQVAVNLDRTPPVLTAGSNPASANRGNRTVRVNVSGTATDALSLINPASGSYSVKNGANVVVATGTFTISNGAYGFQVNLSANTRQTFTITVKAKDQADNTGTAVTTFVIR